MNSLHSTNKKSLGVRVWKALQLLGCVLGMLLLSLPLFSQGATGRILGTVVDQSGGAIVGATVTVLDKDRGVSRTLTTDDAGVYNAPNLTPGNYTVRAESKGFKTFERQSIGLDVGKEVRIDATLQPGDQTQTITITESVPLVETTNATLGGTLETADIADLPLNGRDYQNLMGLRPGVMLQPGGGPWTQSTNGVRPDESVWMVDGVINSNFFDTRPIGGMPSPFMDSAIILPIDAIQEFNLMENPKAEYGWKPGAVVNVGIKSGTNELHGSLYAFGRTDSWDARNYFNVGPTGGSCLLGGGSPLSVCNKVPVQLKQFGGVVGGKIKKDKLFYFVAYEGARSSVGSDLVAGVPSNATAGGDATHSMPDAIAALATAGPGGTPIPVSQVSLNTMGCVMLPAIACTAGANGYGVGPAGKAGLLPFNGTNTYLSIFPNVNQSDNGVGKIDYHPNDKNAIFGTFITGRYTSVGEDHPFVNTAFTDTAPITVYSNVESWVYTPSSTVVNELRFGYDRTSFNFVNVDVNNLANGTGAYNFINTGSTVGGFPNVVINGFGPGQTLGTAANRPQYNTPNPYYDFQDSISLLKGKHSFKFGGEYTKIEADSSIGASARGNFSFTGGIASPTSSALEDFFAGTPASGLLLAGSPAIAAHWSSYAGYVQDDWRVTPKLIINLGLRYEYASPMKAAGNTFGSFDPNVGMIQQGSIGHPTLWKGDHTGFEPRIGFAWDVNGKGTTVVRAGGSLIHTSFPLLTFDGEFGLENDTATSLAAVPTGAAFQCASLANGSPFTNNCPAGGGGSIGLAVNTFRPAALCWDPSIASGPAVSAACTTGQKTIFPVTTAQCGDGAPISKLVHASGFDASPCDIMGVDPNLRSPLVINYNLSVTHTFGSNLSLEVGYVGNRGERLLNFRDINQSPLGAGWCLNALTAAQAADACKGVVPGTGSYNATATQEARPFYTKFPYLGFINFATNAAHSRYDGLQVSATKRMSHGLSFNAGYTYSHALDNGSLNRFGGLPQDSNNVAAEYASSDFDVRHRLTFTATYAIPGIKGFGQLLEGWEINTIVNYQTPQPWTAADGIQPGPAGDHISGTGEGADRWNISGPASSFPSGKTSIPYCASNVVGNVTLPFDTNTTAGTPDVSCTVVNVYGTFASAAQTAAITGCLAHGVVQTLQSFGCYASTDGQSFLTPPALGQFGNMGRNIFKDSGFRGWDMSLFKNFTFKERYKIQFRIEGFNILNHPTAANPYGASSFVNSGNAIEGGGLGFSGLTPDFAAGNPLVGSGSNRAVQLGLKIGF